ncbi:uncharacterized protein LOC111710189 [Eurytemora carolleeae]|uniref:uncharacterized protein LOC111710189 n=1 Tax=Eurytemora carolleeae TaxID=1294199 RepID=UPI000C76A005|nr:uncharacterized protein LOC111710189 [Eurytemora carolleeae]|eukprot:XP_023340015.1 uncharacterized protein LOC111710189 [Eurytemora affinis]
MIKMVVSSIKLNTGRSIPGVGFGTGTSFFNRGDAVADVVKHAYQAGFRSFDCARIYGTEEGLGRGIAELGVDRSELYVTTKTPDWAWSKETIVAEVEGCLKRLKLDYLDLVLHHSPAPRIGAKFMATYLTPEEIKNLPDPLDEAVMDTCRLQMWLGLQLCVEKGLVRDIGVSNFTVNHLKKLLKNPEVTITPAVNQVEFNPYIVDSPIQEYCKQTGILLQAYAPLGNGKDMLLSDPVLERIGGVHNKTAAQVALRWSLELGHCIVTKTEKFDRMKENLDLFNFTLSREEIDQITALNKNKRNFPDPSQFP